MSLLITTTTTTTNALSLVCWFARYLGDQWITRHLEASGREVFVLPVFSFDFRRVEMSIRVPCIANRSGANGQQAKLANSAKRHAGSTLHAPRH